jgi:dolichyl-phosphate-mannose--protein O-mannosyl transferase
MDLPILLSLTFLAGLLRVIRVATPRTLVFDETYYAKDACFYAKASIKACRLDENPIEVHPPLGKWLIAAGIKLFDFNSFGYRIGVVVAGTATVALLYLLARKVLGSSLGAAVSAGLLAIDPLHFVQSRTSMLDVFVPLFVVTALLFAVYDRDRIMRVLESGSIRSARFGLLGRPWRLAAGITAGAAVASKWSGAFAIPLLIALTAAWEVSARRAGSNFRRAVVATIRQEGISIVAWLLLVPLLVYIASYVGRDIDGAIWALPWSDNSWLYGWWEQQTYMLDFHSTLEATHAYQSPAWSWMLLKRPVSYFFETEANGEYKEILATGSPFVWWASMGALVLVGIRWWRHRSLHRPEGIILAGFLFSYGPWLLPFDRPAVFLFYFVATVPFICLALGYVATRIGRSWEARAALALFVIVAMSFFVFYYPILSQAAIPRSQWERRLLFFRDCAKPEGREITETVTETSGGKKTTSESVKDSNADNPPPGWCWI